MSTLIVLGKPTIPPKDRLSGSVILYTSKDGEDVNDGCSCGNITCHYVSDFGDVINVRMIGWSSEPIV